MSRTFLATLQYDGTGFVGWQRQPAGRSVQIEFERVLERLFERRTAAHAAGRTDAGVHSIGQGVSFSAPTRWTDSALRRALNALLPDDCWVASVHPMQPGFHARKSALSRRYQYRIGLDEAAGSPFRRQFEWALGKPLDVELLSSAAQVIRGEHDFRAFAAKTDKPHYRCRVIHADWSRRIDGHGVSLEIEADRFLQRMVRMLVGTMVDIGLGRRPLDDMAILLSRGDNAGTSPPAPPQGLYFAAVVYPPELSPTLEESPVSRYIRRSLPALAITLAILGCGAEDISPVRVATAGAQTSSRVADAQDATNSSRRTALVVAADRAAPAVVSINVTSRQQAERRSPFDFFFVPEGARVVQGSGTGFIIRPNGVIVTNQHVVSNADRVVVTLPDGSDLPATVMGEDPLTDIAVLKVDRASLPTVALGRSTDLMIGEWVVALGNPYAYLLGNSEPSVSVGVVSATGRNILPGGDQTGLYLDMIQTDAAINPGNSGGPLTNALGEVVGVNSSIFSSSGGSVGLGFAIPIERAVRVADEIIKRGSVRRAWVGLDVQGARAMREWKSQGGVVIASITADGPAARAGLRRGDVLVEANGRRLRNYLDWEAVKLDLHVGDAVQVAVRSGNGSSSRRIVTGDLPTVTAEKITVLQDLQLINVTPAIQAERSIRSDQGALIFRLSPQVSRATGLQPGDVILAIDRTPVRNAAEVADLLNVRPGQVIRIYVERESQVTFTDLMFR